MKLCHFVLRLISPRSEKERMEFRKEMARLRATSEDFRRTLSLNQKEIEKALREYRGA